MNRSNTPLRVAAATASDARRDGVRADDNFMRVSLKFGALLQLIRSQHLGYRAHCEDADDDPRDICIKRSKSKVCDLRRQRGVRMRGKSNARSPVAASACNVSATKKTIARYANSLR